MFQDLRLSSRHYSVLKIPIEKKCYTWLMFISGVIKRYYNSHQSHTFIFYSEGLSLLASSIKHFSISFYIAVMIYELISPLSIAMAYACEICHLSCRISVLYFMISFLIRDCKSVSSDVDQRRVAPSWSVGELFQLSTIVLFFLPSRAAYTFFSPNQNP